MNRRAVAAANQRNATCSTDAAARDRQIESLDKAGVFPHGRGAVAPIESSHPSTGELQ
jgi:hypothetical protein